MLNPEPSLSRRSTANGTSPSEGLDVANLLRDTLNTGDRIDAEVWDQDTFQSSLTFIESLEEKLDQSDFAIVALTPDDQSISRGKLQLAPRDNAIFELGFFMRRLGTFGRMGRLRAFFVANRDSDLKIPTDLLGVEPVLFERREGETLAAAIERASVKLKAKVIERGPRERYSPQDLRDRGLLLDFCRRVEGAWWARVGTGQRIQSGTLLGRAGLRDFDGAVRGSLDRCAGNRPWGMEQPRRRRSTSGPDFVLFVGRKARAQKGLRGFRTVYVL